MIGVALSLLLRLKSKSGISEIMTGIVVSFAIISLTLIAYGLSITVSSFLIIRGSEVLAEESVLTLIGAFEVLEFSGDSKSLNLAGISSIAFVYTGNFTLIANGVLIGEWRNFEVFAFTRAPIAENETIFIGGTNYFSINGSSIAAVKLSIAIKLLFRVYVSSFGDHVYVRVYTFEEETTCKGEWLRITVSSVIRKVYIITCPEGVLELTLLRGNGSSFALIKIGSQRVVLLFEVLKLEVK